MIKIIELEYMWGDVDCIELNQLIGEGWEVKFWNTVVERDNETKHFAMIENISLRPTKITEEDE